MRRTAAILIVAGIFISLIYALVIFYSQDERWQDALVYARQLQELAPGNPGVARLLEEIQQQIFG